MQWSDIHSYAIEIELWTTLAINAWLILTGLMFVSGRFMRATVPVAKSLEAAAKLSFAFVFGLAILIFVSAFLFGLIGALMHVLSGISN
jgi:hypothetical protein